jgi:hypothetical protein
MSGATQIKRLVTQDRKRRGRAAPVPPPKDANTVNADIAAWLAEHPDDPAAPLLRRAKDEIVRLTRDQLSSVQDAARALGGGADEALYQSGLFWVNMTRENEK